MKSRWTYKHRLLSATSTVNKEQKAARSALMCASEKRAKYLVAEENALIANLIWNIEEWRTVPVLDSK